MAGPNIELPGLEYLKDATAFQMEQVNEFDSTPPSKIFKIISTNSVCYCCTVPNSNDLVIRDEKHGNNRFCINGVAFPFITVYSFANQPIGWAHKGTDSTRLTDEKPDYDWNWKVKIAPPKIHPNGKMVSSVIWLDDLEWSGSISVESSRITWDMHPSLSPVLKALLLAQGIYLALTDPMYRMTTNQTQPCGIDSLLWVDYTEQLTAEEEAVPVETLQLRRGKFTLRPYLNKREESKCYGFTLSDEEDNVLMILQYTVIIHGTAKGALTGFDVNSYTVFKSKGMTNNEPFVNTMYGPFGVKVGEVGPPKSGDRNGWNFVDYTLADGDPLKTLITDGKFDNWALRFTDSQGELVCTYKSEKGYLTLALERDMSNQAKLTLISYAVKIACVWGKQHTRQPTPVVPTIYPLKYPGHLVRQSTGMKAHFQSVFTQFLSMRMVFIRGGFKIADEDAIFLHLLDANSKEVIYTVRCKVGAVENYLLPFEAEIMDDEGNLVLFAHQPATVPTLMINQKEGNNIGVYEHGQCEGSECESSLQTDDGRHFGKVHRFRAPQLGVHVVDRHNMRIAGMRLPCPNITELSIADQLTCDQVMVIVAAAIREAFYTFRIQQHLPIFPTRQ